MSSTLVSADGVVRATCTDCGWTLEREFEEKDLPPEDNQEIVDRLARRHAFDCGEEWDDNGAVHVELDLSGGDL